MEFNPRLEVLLAIATAALIGTSVTASAKESVNPNFWGVAINR